MTKSTLGCEISNNLKLSQSDYIHHVTSYMTSWHYNKVQKKDYQKQDTEIDIFEFELYYWYYFKKKDVDKNVEFKKINGINYNIWFSFTWFFKKQIEKTRLHVVQIFGINTIH